MAIKVGNVTVIDDNRKIGSSAQTTTMDDCVIDDFHPNVLTTTGVIDLGKAFQKITLGSNVAFTTSNNSSAYDGAQTTILLDRSATLYTPTFASNVLFPSTPSWGTNRYWTLSFASWTDYQIRATAVPFDAYSAPSSSFSNFSLSGWDTNENSWGLGTPWAAVYITFQHQSSNDRIAITYTTGNSRTGSTQNTVYANYTGLTGISSIQVQYNIVSQSYSGDNPTAGGAMGGPLPTDDSLNPSTYYNVPETFAWYCESDSGDSLDSSAFASFNSSDPDFRVKIVCNEGTFYSTAEVPLGSVSVYTNYGSTAGVGGGL